MTQEMSQEIQAMFEIINEEDDFKYDKPLDKAKLFMKIYNALDTISEFEDFDKIKLKEIYKDLEYNYNKFNSSYDSKFYEERINLIITRNSDEIMKLINFYYNNVKDNIGNSEDSLY